MLDGTKKFNVKDDADVEMKRILTTVYDALMGKRLQSHQPDSWLYPFGRSDLHHKLPQRQKSYTEN